MDFISRFDELARGAARRLLKSDLSWRLPKLPQHNILVRCFSRNESTRHIARWLLKGQLRDMPYKLNARPSWWPLRSSEYIRVKNGLGLEWQRTVNINRYSDYGYAVILATIAVIKELDDTDRTPEQAFTAIDDLGLTGFMAGAAAQQVSYFHPRGEEFRTWYNLKTQIRDEGVKANASGSILNPALLVLGVKASADTGAEGEGR